MHGAHDALEAAVARSFETSEIDRGALGDIQPGIVVARGGTFRALTPRSNADLSRLPAAWRTLPVALAEELLVKPAQAAGAEIAYEHDTERAIAAGTAILLRAVIPTTLRRVADAGEQAAAEDDVLLSEGPGRSGGADARPLARLSGTRNVDGRRPR